MQKSGVRVPLSPPRRSKVRFAPFFFLEKRKTSARSLAPPFRKSPACSACALASARTASPLRYQLFAGLRLRTGFATRKVLFLPAESTDLVNGTYTAAGSTAFAAIFDPNCPLTRSVAFPFRKQSRLLRLCACKRAHCASAALPAFCAVAADRISIVVDAVQSFHTVLFCFGHPAALFYWQSRPARHGQAAFSAVQAVHVNPNLRALC